MTKWQKIKLQFEANCSLSMKGLWLEEISEIPSGLFTYGKWLVLGIGFLALTLVLFSAYVAKVVFYPIYLYGVNPLIFGIAMDSVWVRKMQKILDEMRTS